MIELWEMDFLALVSEISSDFFNLLHSLHLMETIPKLMTNCNFNSFFDHRQLTHQEALQKKSDSANQQYALTDRNIKHFFDHEMDEKKEHYICIWAHTAFWM